MEMSVMELAVELYKDIELKELVQNYIEQKEQEKNISTKGSGSVCDIAHEKNQEETPEVFLKNWICAWLNSTNDFIALQKVYTVMKNLKGIKKEEITMRAMTCSKWEREILSMLQFANEGELKNIRTFVKSYLSN